MGTKKGHNEYKFTYLVFLLVINQDWYYFFPSDAQILSFITLLLQLRESRDVLFVYTSIVNCIIAQINERLQMN